MPMPRNAVSNVTYNDGDLVWAMHAQTDFTGCTFNGTAKSCNFAESAFTNCTFNPAFTFVECNLGNATGLPERLAPPPRMEPPLPNRGGRPGTRPGM